MADISYFLIFFDCGTNINSEETITERVINRLRNFYYPADSLQLSRHAVLVKADAGNRPALKEKVQEALDKEYNKYLEGGEIEDNPIFNIPAPKNKRPRSYFEVPDVNYYILPTSLDAIEEQLVDFQNEIAYFNSKDSKE